MNTKNILINQTNVVPGTKNSQYVYKFSTPQNITNSSSALHSLQIYYSWFNVNASLYNNNQLQYLWWDSSGVLNQTFTITIPDGFYSATTLNLFIQSQMLKNNHYLYDTTAKSNIYFFQLVSNPTYYAFQIYITPMYARASVPPNFTKPSNSWNYPLTQETPRIIINSSNNFKSLIGFDAGTYPPTSQAVLYDKLSQNTPELSPITSLVIRCNLVLNDLANPNDVLYSFTSGTKAFGDILDERPSNLFYNKVQNGTYNEIRLTFTDQNFQPVQIIDSQLLITLLIQEKENIL
jgi:hypothetical protein